MPEISGIIMYSRPCLLLGGEGGCKAAGRGMSKREAEMEELTIEATPENIDTVVEFVDSKLEEFGCDMNEQMAIDVAIDELFTNIASYAYSPEVGLATVRVDLKEDTMSVEITFIDQGKKFDPLAKEDPDTTLDIEDRPIGGMGILIVKKSMDSVDYEYKDGKNILTIRKKIKKNPE